MCSASRKVLPTAGSIARARWIEAGIAPENPPAASSAACFRKSRREFMWRARWRKTESPAPRIFANFRHFRYQYGGLLGSRKTASGRWRPASGRVAWIARLQRVARGDQVGFGLAASTWRLDQVTVRRAGSVSRRSLAMRRLDLLGRRLRPSFVSARAGFGSS
jgi:hypothetical protein